jgi:hypothetical protein
LVDIAWTCAPDGGASCTPTGSGDVADIVDLPAGGAVAYTIDATVRADAAGQIASVAAVTPPPGYDDPDPTDNAATDTDAVIGDRLFADGFDPG